MKKNIILPALIIICMGYCSLYSMNCLPYISQQQSLITQQNQTNESLHCFLQKKVHEVIPAELSYEPLLHQEDKERLRELFNYTGFIPQTTSETRKTKKIIYKNGFICKECGKKYTYKLSFDEHIKKMHNA